MGGKENKREIFLPGDDVRLMLLTTIDARGATAGRSPFPTPASRRFSGKTMCGNSPRDRERLRVAPPGAGEGRNCPGPGKLPAPEGQRAEDTIPRTPSPGHRPQDMVSGPGSRRALPAPPSPARLRHRRLGPAAKPGLELRSGPGGALTFGASVPSGGGVGPAESAPPWGPGRL